MGILRASLRLTACKSDGTSAEVAMREILKSLTVLDAHPLTLKLRDKV